MDWERNIVILRHCLADFKISRDMMIILIIIIIS